VLYPVSLFDSDLREFPDAYEHRLKASNKLETAEFKPIATANKLHRQHTLALAKAAEKGKDIASVKAPVPEADLEPGALQADKLVPRSQRPSHRLPPFKWLPFGLPFMGEKVDTIEWSRKELLKTDTELKAGHRKLKHDRANVSVDIDKNYPSPLPKLSVYSLQPANRSTYCRSDYSP
jgi:hypothetical protein